MLNSTQALAAAISASWREDVHREHSTRSRLHRPAEATSPEPHCIPDTTGTTLMLPHQHVDSPAVRGSPAHLDAVLEPGPASQVASPSPSLSAYRRPPPASSSSASLQPLCIPQAGLLVDLGTQCNRARASMACSPASDGDGTVRPEERVPPPAGFPRGATSRPTSTRSSRATSPVHNPQADYQSFGAGRLRASRRGNVGSEPGFLAKQTACPECDDNQDVTVSELDLPGTPSPQATTQLLCSSQGYGSHTPHVGGGGPGASESCCVSPIAVLSTGPAAVVRTPLASPASALYLSGRTQGSRRAEDVAGVDMSHGRVPVPKAQYPDSLRVVQEVQQSAAVATNCKEGQLPTHSATTLKVIPLVHRMLCFLLSPSSTLALRHTTQHARPTLPPPLAFF